MKKVIVSCIILATGVTALAYGEGPNSPNGTRGGAGNPSASAVRGTPAGLPPTAQTLYAAVNADGSEAQSLPRSSPFDVQTAKTGDGQYEVVFPGRNMRECAYEATIGLAGTSVAPNGFIQVDALAGEPNGVFIKTSDTANALADRPFHLAVHC